MRGWRKRLTKEGSPKVLSAVINSGNYFIMTKDMEGGDNRNLAHQPLAQEQNFKIDMHYLPVDGGWTVNRSS